MSRIEPGFNRSARTLSWVGLLLAAGLVGCGASGPKAVLSGRVTYEGKPFSGGMLKIVGQEGAHDVILTVIAPDGAYQCPGPPLGLVKFAVIGPGTPSGPDPVKKPPSVVLPKRYADPETSGLSTTVKEGQQTFDMDLTSK